MSKGRYFCGGSALAVTLALVGGGHALAQSQADIQASFSDADKDKNGRLDAAEFATLPQGIRDKAVDANGDGFYILAELTPSRAASEATEVRAVVSVGTYLKSGAEDTALNIESQSRDDLLKTGSPSMEQLIRNLSESGLNENGDNRGQNSLGVGVRTINLRNLGAGRTLILFDGVRLADDPQSNGGPGVSRDPNVQGGGAQNVNNIPMEILATVEVLKDGGSSAYGGDASGGAVNFTPRRDLNGFEAAVSYRYVADTDGDYDANIQWGKRRGSENFLFSAFYSHQSPLAGRDRDFIHRSFVQNQYNFGWGPFLPDYRTEVFAAPGSTISSTNAYQFASYGLANPLYVSGPGVTNPIQDYERGTLRDDLCMELGGLRSFNSRRLPVTGTTGLSFQTNVQPICAYERWRTGYLREDTDVYRVFADATVNITDNVRWHTSLTFSKTQVTVVDQTIQEALACDPWPTNAPSYTTTTTGAGTTPERGCVRPSVSNLNRTVYTTTSAGTQTGPTIPGYNPAVRDYLLRYYSNFPTPETGQRVFSDAQINQITGCVTLSTVSNTYVTSTVANEFQCTFASDIPVLTGRTYLIGNGTLANGFFTPGSTSNTQAVSLAGAFTVLGPMLGQGYTPTQGVTNLTVNIGTAGAPVNFAVQLALGAQTSTTNPLSNPLFDPDGVGTTSTLFPTVSLGSGLPGQYGKVLMRSDAFAPFVDMYNTAFKDHGRAFFNAQISSLIVSQDIKGDLGEHFGTALDFTVRGRFQRQVNRQVGAQAMADRFQRALNGFASDIDDLGPNGLGCETAETQGTRVLQIAPGVFYSVTGVPYTVGAGGGTDYDPATGGIQRAEFGYNPGANLGNRCFFFNPFASAVRVSKLNGARIVADNGTAGFVGADTPSALGTSTSPGTLVGAPGDYQGYGQGMGLENSPGVLRWIFQQRENRSMSDQVLVQGILNGEFTKFELPGGPIDWGLVVQYSYQNRDSFSSPLGNRDINPCPFMRQAVPRYTAVNNLINNTSTCSGNEGLFATQNSTVIAAPGALTTGFANSVVGGGYQQNINHSILLEWNLPFVQRALLHNTIRYEENKGPNDIAFRGATIYSTDLKWQAFDNLAFTGNISMNFDSPANDEPGQTINLLRTSPTGGNWYTGVGRSEINQFSQTSTYTNTELGPESGTNYSVGAIFQTRDRASQVRLTFFSDRVGGAPFRGLTNSSIMRALTHNPVRNSNIELDVIIDCNDPTLQAFFRRDGANGLFDGQPFAQFTDGVSFYPCGDNTALGGPNITTFTAAGVDVDGDDQFQGVQDLGVALNVPNQINGGFSVRQGVEIGANHRLQRMVYGGVVNLSADITWNLKNRSTAIFAYGQFIADGVDSIGTLNDGFSNFANVWGGSMSVNYNKGKHNVRLGWRWQGSVVDNSGLGLAQASTPVLLSVSTNANPRDTTLCDTANSGLGLPYTPQPVSDQVIADLVGDILVGEGAYNFNCEMGDLKGYKVNGQSIGSITYRVELPSETTLTVSVDNILGTKPSFARFIDNYNPFAAVGPEGRTVKVEVRKKF